MPNRSNVSVTKVSKANVFFKAQGKVLFFHFFSPMSKNLRIFALSNINVIKYHEKVFGRIACGCGSDGKL